MTVRAAVLPGSDLVLAIMKFGDRRHLAAGLQVAGEAFDVGAAGLEQAQVVLVAPTGVLAQVQLAGFAGQAAVAGQCEPPGAGYRLGSVRGSPNQGSMLVSKRVMPLIWWPVRVRTQKAVAWRVPSGPCR